MLEGDIKEGSGFLVGRNLQEMLMSLLQTGELLGLGSLPYSTAERATTASPSPAVVPQAPRPGL